MFALAGRATWASVREVGGIRRAGGGNRVDRDPSSASCTAGRAAARARTAGATDGGDEVRAERRCAGNESDSAPRAAAGPAHAAADAAAAAVVAVTTDGAVGADHAGDRE